MILRIDTDAAVVEVEGEDGPRLVPFSDPEAFTLVSKAWLRVGWDAKYVYRFSWLGRPIIQLPEDIVRLQELFFGPGPMLSLRPGSRTAARCCSSPRSARRSGMGGSWASM